MEGGLDIPASGVGADDGSGGQARIGTKEVFVAMGPVPIVDEYPAQGYQPSAGPVPVPGIRHHVDTTLAAAVAAHGQPLPRGVRHRLLRLGQGLALDTGASLAALRRRRFKQTQAW